MRDSCRHYAPGVLVPLGLVLLGTHSIASEFIGKVVSVIDGHTIEVLDNSKAKRIRLIGIDCPEKGQAYGKRAKHAASGLAFGKKVTVQMHGHDMYKRTLAAVLLPDGTNVNHELVKDGWCWRYGSMRQGMHLTLLVKM